MGGTEAVDCGTGGTEAAGAGIGVVGIGTAGIACVGAVCAAGDVAGADGLAYCALYCALDRGAGKGYLGRIIKRSQRKLRGDSFPAVSGLYKAD